MQKKTSKAVQNKSGSIATVVWLTDRRRFGTRRLGMHGKQFGSADVLAFPLERLDERGPCRRRDALALTPLDDRPMTLTNVRRHLSDGVPAVEKLFEGFHPGDSSRYKLSRKERAGFPVHGEGVSADNSRMGRARSPVQFNKEIAARLKAARISAGYENVSKFADLLGVGYERYKKWEGGRTPIQHEYIPRACELTGKDANYFYGIRIGVESERRVAT